MRHRAELYGRSVGIPISTVCVRKDSHRSASSHRFVGTSLSIFLLELQYTSASAASTVCSWAESRCLNMEDRGRNRVHDRGRLYLIRCTVAHLVGMYLEEEV